MCYMVWKHPSPLFMALQKLLLKIEMDMWRCSVEWNRNLEKMQCGKLCEELRHSDRSFKSLFLSPAGKSQTEALQHGSWVTLIKRRSEEVCDICHVYSSGKLIDYCSSWWTKLMTYLCLYNAFFVQTKLLYFLYWDCCLLQDYPTCNAFSKTTFPPSAARRPCSPAGCGGYLDQPLHRSRGEKLLLSFSSADVCWVCCGLFLGGRWSPGLVWWGYGNSLVLGRV